MEKRIDVLKLGSGRLSRSSVINHLGESEIFLSHILNCTRTDLYLDNLIVDKKEQEEFLRLIDLRAKGLPLQYILGFTEFFGLKLKIIPGVFIPRPETEILVETVIDILTDEPTNRRTNEPTILDVGTGCGNIAISVAKGLRKAHLPSAGGDRRAYIFACDISDSALQLAKENSHLNKVNIYLVKSDLFLGFKKQNNFSLIVSNPPYIKTEDFSRLSREIHYEPQRALNGGCDGLFYYYRIIDAAPAYLSNGGWLVLEVGDGEAQAVREILLRNIRLSLVKAVRDYSNVERVVVAQKVK